MTDNGMTDYSWFFQSAVRACLDALGQDIRVDLERQVNDLESVPAEDLVPLLPQVTKSVAAWFTATLCNGSFGKLRGEPSLRGGIHGPGT